MPSTRSVVSITDMARMVGLSRQRFGQLVREGVFPAPDHDQIPRRPFYDLEKQQQCLQVRHTHTGANGKPILFYSRRRDIGTKRSPVRSPKPDQDLTHQLAELGIVVSLAEISAAIAIVFPAGTSSVPRESLLKSLFLHFRRKNKADSDG